MPVAFSARTWNVYAVSFTRLPTVWLVAAAPLPGMFVQLPYVPKSAFCRYW